MWDWIWVVATATVDWLARQSGVAQAVVTMKAEDVAVIADDKLRAAIQNSYYPDRFGDLYLHPQPFWQTNEVAATHGSIHEYDVHAPLYLYGQPFGKSSKHCRQRSDGLGYILGRCCRCSLESPRDGRARWNAP